MRLFIAEETTTSITAILMLLSRFGHIPKLLISEFTAVLMSENRLFGWSAGRMAVPPSR